MLVTFGQDANLGISCFLVIQSIDDLKENLKDEYKRCLDHVCDCFEINFKWWMYCRPQIDYEYTVLSGREGVIELLTSCQGSRCDH